MNFSIHSRRGQTLVEALVALSILTAGFVGIVTLLTKSFQLNRTTSNDTQATYLAAEGIEVAKNLIDHDVYTGLTVRSNDWAQSFPESGYYYDIDYETTSTVPLTSLNFSLKQPESNPLYFNPTTHMFSYNSLGAQSTNFIRNVKVINNGEELDVQSTVTWTDGGQSNTITLEDHFYNWNQ
jgi:Tfp pilus assembly protein PilV